MHESLNRKVPFYSRKVYVGVSYEIANSFVVEVVSHFLNKYDDQLRPKVMMISGEHEKLSEQLRFRELDVVVSPMRMTHPDLMNLESLEVPVNLICTKDPDTILKESDLEKSSYNWVMPHQGPKLRSEINKFFETNLIKGRIVFESDVIESLTRSVVDNVGVAFLPLIYVPKEIEGRTIEAFGPPEGHWSHRLWIASHLSGSDDSLIKSISESFKAFCTPLLVKHNKKREEVI